MGGSRVEKGRAILLGFALFLFCLFFIGFHNMDNCHNMLMLNAELKEFNVSYAENSLFIKEISGAGCYMLGASLMLYSGIIGLLLCIILLFERRNI